MATPTASGPPARVRRARGLLGDVVLLRWAGIRAVVIWLVLGSVLGEVAASVRDYMDFDAGRYERLAISVAETHSLMPRINGVDIHYVSMLYPVLLAPFFVGGSMWKDLENAQVASAYIMAFACVPAFLLTRRVAPGRRWAPYFVAVFTVGTPWIVTSMTLMTEVASYAACAWALYAMVVAIASPSRTHDLLAAVAIALAFFARGELIVLVFVFPVALVAYELGRTSASGLRARLANAGRSSLTGHPLLTGGYAVAAGAAIVLAATGRLSSTIGIYSVYSSAGRPAWGALPRALAEHMATFSLGVGVIPCVIALAWMGANTLRPAASRDAHAFACVSTVMVVVVFVQATNFDLVVNAYIHDRFLMYFVPVMLIGAVLGVVDARLPRWSLVPPLALIVAGFLFGDIPAVTWSQFPWLDIDTPVSTVYRVLAAHLGGLSTVRGLLAALAVAGAGLVVLGDGFRRRGLVALTVFGFCAVAMSAATSWTFVRAFDSIDRNGRSLTASVHGTLDWIDGAVGSNARVTAIPYPVSSDWFVDEKAWVDYEYFNKSLVRIARVAGSDAFDYTGFWFPKLDLHFDAANGAVTESPTPWIAQSVSESRFRVVGPATFTKDGVELINAGPHWRLEWLTFGLYDDGWTKPDTPVRMRLFAAPGQQGARIRTVGFVLRAPSGGPARAVTVHAGGATSRIVVSPSSTNASVQICVPAHGYAQIVLTAAGASSIPGDLATLAESLRPRRGGVFLASIGEADEIGAACSPSA